MQNKGCKKGKGVFILRYFTGNYTDIQLSYRFYTCGQGLLTQGYKT